MSISIAITAGADTNSSSVSQAGNVQQIATPAQIASFFSSTNLTDAVTSYANGSTPDDIFTCSPTPWGDLYSTYGWPQVQSMLTVQSATIVEVNATPCIVATQSFSNTTGAPMQCTTNMDYSSTVGSSTTWTTEDSITASQSVSYGIGFPGTGVEGETSLSYSHTWGTADTEEESVTLGTGASVTFELPAGESRVAELVTSQGTATVQVVYQMTLSGDIAVNYSDTWNGHHFWAFDVNAVLGNSNLPTVITATETIVINMYTDASIVLKDGSTLQVFPTGAKFADRAVTSARSVADRKAPALA